MEYIIKEKGYINLIFIDKFISKYFFLSVIITIDSRVTTSKFFDFSQLYFIITIGEIPEIFKRQNTLTDLRRFQTPCLKIVSFFRLHFLKIVLYLVSIVSKFMSMIDYSIST